MVGFVEGARGGTRRARREGLDEREELGVEGRAPLLGLRELVLEPRSFWRRRRRRMGKDGLVERAWKKEMNGDGTYFEESGLSREVFGVKMVGENEPV